MELERLKDILRTVKEFRQIEGWKFTRITSGGASPNKFRLRNGKKDYYVKEINEQERRILPVLVAIKSKLIPPVAHPDLLAKDVLVSPYLGPCVRPGGKLEPRLYREYARTQNTLNDPAVLRRLKASHGFKGNTGTAAFYRSGVGLDLSGPIKCVRRAKRKFGWPFFDVWLKALASIERRMPRIAREYAGMPFGRLHYDFREDNIVGKPQRLADWGSSYDHGPFMYDVALHIGGDDRAWKAFVETSDICRKALLGDLARWLWLASCIRLTEKAWHTDPRQGWVKTYARRSVFHEMDRFSWMPRLALSRAGKEGMSQ